MKILVTGCAGFIGYNLVRKLLSYNHTVIGYDNLDSYYDYRIKIQNLVDLGLDGWKVYYLNPGLKNQDGTFEFYSSDKVCYHSISDAGIDSVIHLAGRPGARNLKNDQWTVMESNLLPFTELLEFCRASKIKNIIYASSSSVYGRLNNDGFNRECDPIQPKGIYAVSKYAMETVAAKYQSEDMNLVGARLFSVYGPYMRPDLFLMRLLQSVRTGETVDLFRNGLNSRDMTYIDDVTEALIIMVTKLHQGVKLSPIINIGRGCPISLVEIIDKINDAFPDSKLKWRSADQALEDPIMTRADTSLAKSELGWEASTEINVGLEKLFNWYKTYDNRSRFRWDLCH